MKKKIVVDGMFSGTGLRDMDEGGYLEHNALPLSSETSQWLNKWLARYATAHLDGYKSQKEISELDSEGVKIALQICEEVADVECGYYSNGLLEHLI